MECPNRDLNCKHDSCALISKLWHSNNENDWLNALNQYWNGISEKYRKVEEDLSNPNLLKKVKDFDGQGWFEFLRDECYFWKYTDSRWYDRNTKQLSRHYSENSIDRLSSIRIRLVDESFDRISVRGALKLLCCDNASNCGIHGLGTAGASGLLALLYPGQFATADQMVVKAVLCIDTLDERDEIQAIRNPSSLSQKQGEILIRIMRNKASELCEQFKTTAWTPRKVDMALWSYRSIL